MSCGCGNSSASVVTSGRSKFPDLDRITWRDGQLLTSRDLRDDAQDEEIERRLHIKYLHRTWGVVEGLNVVALGANLYLTVGYALNIEGRELLLPALTTVEPPEEIITPTTMYLVITHASLSGCRCGTCALSYDLTTLCPGLKTRASLEIGVLSWKTVKQVRWGIDVLLARVVVSKGVFASAPDTSVQRRAASLAATRTFSDSTEAGSTNWTQPDQLTHEATAGRFFFLQTTVDTSHAGFVETPAYFARAVGAPPAAASYITDTAPSSFTFVLRVQNTDAAKSIITSTTAAASIAIRWLAVELPQKPQFASYVTPAFEKGNTK